MFFKRIPLTATLVFLLLAAGFATRFWMLANPNQVVFDEVHFGKFATAYFTGEYYFDIHPPLGKLLIALGAWFGGYGAYVKQYGVFDFPTIGAPYGAVPYVGFRLFPALAGALLPLVVFWLVKNLGARPFAAFFAGMLVAFDNALLAQSRIALMDSFLLLFGFAGLAAFFASRNKNYNGLLLAGSGVLFGLSASVKWTGLAFLALAGLVYAYDTLRFLWQNRSRAFSVCARKAGIAALVFLVIPFAVYFALFVAHFRLLPQCPQSTQGEVNGCSYMDPGFIQKGVVEKFVQLNQKMYFYNTTLNAKHPYGSPAWTWPFMTRPVYYWVGPAANEATPRIYLIGNPAVWFLGLLGIVGSVFISKKTKERKFIYAVLLAGYALDFLPFFDISRVLFLYHYLAALVFSLALFAVWLADATEPMKPKAKYILYAVVGLAVVGLFVFFSPLSYGTALVERAYRMRTWLQSWI